MSASKNLASWAPMLSALLIIVCVAYTLVSYNPPSYSSGEQQSARAIGSWDLEDGIYRGTGTGYAGEITVDVEIAKKQIVAIEIVSQSDDAPYFNRAKAVIDSIIQSQSLDVDTVSGATYSSRGIISAVRNALTGEVDDNAAVKKTGKGTTSISAVDEPAAYVDGTYYGSGAGFNGTIRVKVVISGGKIASIAIVSHSDDAPYFTRASVLTSRIVAAQTTNVDTVSGATYSSVGIITAVRNALAQAAVSTSASTNKTNTAGGNQSDTTTPLTPAEPGESLLYNDGTYSVSVVCLPDEDEDFEKYNLSMDIEIQGDTIVGIANVEGDGASSNDRYISWALDGRSGAGVKAQILAAGNLSTLDWSDIDAVSRATCTSKSIVEACRKAMELAKKTGSEAESETGTGQDGAGEEGEQ